MSTSFGLGHPGIGWIRHRGGHCAITVCAAQCGERDDVVLPDVSEGPEKCIAMPGDAKIPRLSRQSRAGNMAHRAPQGSSASSFHDYRGKAETLGFNTTNQAVDRDWRRGRYSGRGATGPGPPGPALCTRCSNRRHSRFWNIQVCKPSIGNNAAEGGTAKGDD